MKKGIRIAFISILFLVGVFMLCWYFMMKREVPKHARCIPKNVIAVLTLNMRALALDQSSGGHLFPERAGEKSKELEPFLRAIEKNDGLGLNETADVLGFFYQDGDAAFFGVIASVKDSLKFGKLIREQMPKQFSIKPFSLRGTTLVRFDTSSAILGWNNDVAVFLFPFSNHDATVTANQCAKLLAQSEEESILTNESFREHELSSFDAGIWIQTKPFLEFTEGGKLFRTAFDDVKYISLALDFQNGELDIRRIIEGDGKKHNISYNGPLLLTCDPKQVKGYWRIPIDFQNDSLINSLARTMPYNILPLNDEQSKKLAATLDGNCTLLYHDTLSYTVNYITYEYDENFNRIPKSEMKREITNGITACFGLKNEKSAKQFLTEWMKEDSIPFNGGSWLIEDQGATQRMMISENVLTITNWPQADGKKREIPEELQGLDLYFPIGEYFSSADNSALFFLFSKYDGGQKLLGEHIKLVTISTPLLLNNKRSSQMRLAMANKEVNALVQLEELFGKMVDGGK